MKTISGPFNTHDEARSAVYALEDAGIPVDDISMISQQRGNTDADNDCTAESAAVGAAVGGAGGLLAGLGAFAIPGIGSVVGAGWLASTLIGVAAGGVAGGMIGSLIDSGINENDAHVYAEGVKRGGTLVTARVEETELGTAQAILNHHRPIDTATRRREYEASGWDGFVQEEIWDADIGNEDRPARDEPVVTPFPR
jgi:uncharacterized membrane protein